MARRKRPDWQFSQTALADIPDGACDLAMCFDVLIHQDDPRTFDEFVDGLCRISREAVLVSGYSDADPIPPEGIVSRLKRRLFGGRAPGESQGIVFRHESLKDKLLRRSDIGRVDVIGGWRDVVLLQATKSDSGRFQEADISADRLGAAAMLSQDPELLRRLVAMSREKVRFFPETIIRSFEYPWFANQMRDVKGGNILDVGAGVSVMPFWLAHHGAAVTTVDISPRQVHIRDGESWNEWGFLDYSEIDPRIRSFNQDMSELETDTPFDFIYSVSVIEHMPADIRRMVLARMSAVARPGARLLLSVDIVPGTNDLWPFSEGKIVDSDQPHGTLDDLLSELAEIGATQIETSFLRGVDGSRTDVTFLKARFEAG